MNLSSVDSLMRAFKLGLQFVELNKDKLQRTIEAHGGRFEHKLNPDKGNRTEFTLILPVIRYGS